MGRNTWYKKWQDNRSFIVENDCLKTKSYIFSPYPRCNQLGFIDLSFKGQLIADVYSRYYRMNDKNVLFPTGFHTLGASSFNECMKLNKTLDTKIQDTFLEEIKSLGIGINQSKLIDARSDSYVSILQASFIELYEKGYIKYKEKEVLENKDSKKIIYKDKDKNNNLIKKKEYVFSLEIDTIFDNLLNDINNLDIDIKYKDKFLSYFEPKESYIINFKLTNDLELNVKLNEIEYLSNISYIFLNPEYIDVINYSAEDEIDAINDYLENGLEPYAYTGINAINPLTGYEIPVFISTIYNEGIYLGIPGLKEEDYSFALKNGFEIIDILDSDLRMINSGILNGLSMEIAKLKLVDEFSKLDIIKKIITYNKKEIILSSNDAFGCLYPFLYDSNTNKLNSLKDFLPFNFTNQFRPLLSPLVNIFGDPLNGSINNLFTEGMAPFLALLYDEFSNFESLFSKIAKEEYNNWIPIDTLIVNEDYIEDELLMPIIFFNIIKKEVGITSSKLFNNLIIVKNNYDSLKQPIKRENNNTINIKALLDDYYSDSLRYYMLSKKINDIFVFDILELNEIDSFIKEIENRLINIEITNDDKLDYYFYNFKAKAKKLIDEYKIDEYISLISDFAKEFILKANPSKDNILTFIKVIFPITPYLSEEIYEIVFKAKYSIINEDF